ncbi:hypothetical protein KAJ27_00280 [bacterium]|nr:hypothetical protein [bacterium]
MDKKCKFCKQTLLEDQLEITSGIATCTHCSAVFEIEDCGNAEKKRLKEEVTLPAEFTVEKYKTVLTLKYNWNSSIFKGLWVVAILVLYLLLGPILESQDIFTLKKFYSNLADAFFAISAAYGALAILVNKSVIRVTSFSIDIDHKPLPWPGNKSIKSKDIDQIYCKVKVHHGSGASKGYTYEVHASMREGMPVKLISGLPESDQALFLEQEIEKFLKIEDKWVAGEMD